MIFILFLFLLSFSNSSDISGNYVVDVHNVTTCLHYPDTINIDTQMKTENTSAGKLYQLYVEYNLTNPIGPVGVNASISIWNKAKNKYEVSPFGSIHTNRICDWFFLSALVTSIPKVNKRCYFQKSHSKFVFFDLDRVVHKVLGNRFLYGEYNTTIMLLSKRQVYMCRQFITSARPISK